MSSCWFLLVQISGQKMKPEFKKVLHLFEELEEAGESATLTITSRKGISTIKLLLESSPPLPTASTTTPTSLPPVPGKRRRHRGAAARTRRRQRAADHQADCTTIPSCFRSCKCSCWLPPPPTHPSFPLSKFWETPGGFLCGKAGGPHLLESGWRPTSFSSLFSFSINIWRMAANKGRSGEVSQDDEQRRQVLPL